MHFKAVCCVWLLALFANRTVCQGSHGQGGGGGSSGGQGGQSGGGGQGGQGGGGGQGGQSGGGGQGGQSGGGGQGGGSGRPGEATFTINGMNMNGMQLPFPFFPPFVCDVECLPLQVQVVQQQMPQPMPTPVTTARPPPPTTTQAPPPPTTQAPPPKMTYNAQQVLMVYPNWCQGWCRFFYKQPAQPVYYQQPNCILFSWMNVGMGYAAQF